MRSLSARPLLICALFLNIALLATPEQDHSLRIMFWNVHNLFDTANDPRTRDDDFTPSGKEKWTDEKLRIKIKALASVIREVNPDVGGFAEVENIEVLRMLGTEAGYPYAYLIERGDQRGIDTGVLSKTSLQELQNKGPGRGLIHFKIKGVTIAFAHWKSKRGGKNQTEEKRLQAARYAVTMTDRLLLTGDFNEGPHEKAREVLEEAGFRNLVTGPCSSFFSGKKGTSKSCIDGAYLRGECISGRAEIVHPHSLAQGSKPNPEISYHLPVVTILNFCEKESESAR